MQFRTSIHKSEYPFKLDYSTEAMFIGSCFTENIGRKIQRLKFPVMVNPFGILYNPMSIKNAINRIMKKKKFNEKDLVYDKGLWHSLMHHGRFSNPDEKKCIDEINSEMSKAETCLAESKIIFITFGTAWVYEYIETGKVVGNCHKLPADKFNKRLLSVDEITVEYYHLINNLQNYLPNLKIVLSVSPVRYIKDGLHENTLSKSILHIAIRQLEEHFENVFYFPAYELLIDDLRDYRFYDDDMVHPSAKATEYVFDAFSDSFFDENTKKIIAETEKITTAASHRIIHPNTPDNRKFKETMLRKLIDLSERYPNLDFSEEKKYFEGL